jgi:acyl-CoA synthetase (AMP-forming)/AMP-acid ligase II
MEGDVILLHELLERAASRLSGKVALVCGDVRMTYGEIRRQASRLAATLARCGVERGDRVVIFAPTCTEAVVAFWGVLKVGAVVAIIHASTKPDKLAWYLDNSGAKAVVSTRALLPVVAQVLPRCPSVAALVLAAPAAAGASLSGWSGQVVAWEEAVAAGAAPPRRSMLDLDLAAIIYTSGSRGSPRGVMMTHLNMRTAAASISTCLGLREDDVILGLAPLSFDYGLYQMMLLAFRAGARVVLEPSLAVVNDVLRRVVDEKVTCFPGAPAVFSMLADHGSLSRFDLSTVRLVTSTAALSLQHVEFLRRTFRGARTFSMYGPTECQRCTYLPPEDLERKPLSVGIAVPNTELWVVDDQGRKLRPNQVGQLVIRGATVMRGYWDNPEATARRLKPGPLPGEQVLYTGDCCRLDEDGYLYVVGRMDDIATRSEKVAAGEDREV